MGTVFRIFANDVKSVVRHFFAMAVIVAISVLPALYAWVNIYANGDPYGSTGNIKIAVASEDEGIKLDDGTYVNMSEEVFDTLRESDSIGWQFPSSSADAIEGVRSGEYYAAIIFGDKFTYNMYHIGQAANSDDAALTFYQNAKKNAIAAKITETAASTLQETINTKYLQTLFKTVFSGAQELADNVGSEAASTDAIGQLTRLRDNLDDYADTIGDFVQDSEGVRSSLREAGKLINSTDRLDDAYISSAQADLMSAKDTVDRLSAGLQEALTDLRESLDALEKSIKKLEGIADEAESDLPSRKEALDEARLQADSVLKTLEDLRAAFPESSDILGAQAAMDALDAMIKRAETVKELLIAVPDDSGSVELSNTVHETAKSVEMIRQLEEDNLKPDFDAMISHLSQILDSLYPFLDSLNGMVDDAVPVIDSADETVVSLTGSLSQLQKMFRSASDKITDVIDAVNAARANEKIKVLIDRLGGDSDMYGTFFSALVDVDIQEIYQVASYGAAMAPFYSVLALWVGGVILVAILKTEADRKKFPAASEAQCFFGRFLLFFLLGQIQSAIIVAGDIYLLHCDPVHPGLMYLAAGVTSFVFILLIYSLTRTFGDVGKAIVVVTMVVQIAGSSGSYPIEILPVIFSKIYRFFPFPYAINAIREALCGTYGNDYWIYLGELLVFAVLALVIGLIVRKKFIGMSEFVAEKLEETEVL